MTTSVYIDDFSSSDATNSPAATDSRRLGDDEIRNLKGTLKRQFPSLGAAAVNATAAELNALVGITSTVAELNILDGVTATFDQLNYVNVTLGQGTASKAVTVDALGAWTMLGLTCADLGTVTTVDLNGGTIDATVIGATTPAAGSFTSLAPTSLNINSTVNLVGTIDDDTMATATATTLSTSESVKQYVDDTALPNADHNYDSTYTPTASWAAANTITVTLGNASVGKLMAIANFTIVGQSGYTVYARIYCNGLAISREVSVSDGSTQEFTIMGIASGLSGASVNVELQGKTSNASGILQRVNLSELAAFEVR